MAGGRAAPLTKGPETMHRPNGRRGPYRPVAALLALSLMPLPAAAEDLATLVREQRALLERQAARLQALEKRVAELEGPAPPQPGPAPRVAPASPPGAGGPAKGEAPVAEVGRFPDDAVVRVGAFDRAYMIPGTALSMRVGGFVQADGIYDTAQVGSPDSFLARTIAVGRDGDAAVRFSGRNTRLNVDVRGDGPWGPMRAFLEGDFGGGGGTELVSNSYSFRLRHAFLQAGPLYAGQYWTAFTDLGAFPETLDTTSPAGKVVTRQAGLRWVARLAPGTTLALAAENPETDVTLSRGRTAVERAPDLAAALRAERPWGHVQLAGLGRALAVDGSEGEDRALGWGLNLTGRVGLPLVGAKDNLVFGALGGQGLGRSVVELAGTGNDAALEPGGGLDTVGALGGYLGYQHWWADALRSTLAAGHVQVDVPGFQPAGAFKSATTLSGNLVWNPAPPLTLGAELLWGRRGEKGGADADAFRLQTTARLGF